ADLDGALVKGVIDGIADRLRPAAGQPWDTRAHREADAVVMLARYWSEGHAGPQDHTPRPARVKPLLVVHVPEVGPAEICALPLADAQIEALRAEALVEPVIVDGDGGSVATGCARPAVGAKILRAVLLRDGHCRWPGCGRSDHLDVHHLVPRSW